MMRLTMTLLLLLLSLPAAGQEDPLHPPFPLKNKAGEKTRDPAAMDPAQTCAGCHNSAWVNGHNDHFNETRKVSCLACHVAGGDAAWKAEDLDDQGLVSGQALQIGAPTNSQCGQCHGLVHEGPNPVELPLEYDRIESPDRFGLTRMTGTIVSADKVSESFINVRGKPNETRPWDVHAARGVTCVACHYSRNNPGKADKAVSGDLPYLKRDPRTLSTGDYLRRPDHRLEAATCTRCHDPLAAHEELPYRDRHMEALACQSCHVPTILGPAASTVDATIVDLEGNPIVAYRGVTGGRELEPNVRYMDGYEPFLLPTGDDGPTRLAPFNLVTRWYWVDRTGAEVPARTVRAALVRDGAWRPEVLKALDDDGDRALSDRELRLENEADRALVAGLLETEGIDSPTLSGKVTSHAIQHGVVTSRFVSHDCSDCHAQGTRLATPIPLAAWVPFGAPTNPTFSGPARISGEVLAAEEGGLELVRSLDEEPIYVLGHTRRPWSDWLGFVILVATLFFLAIHATLRIVAAQRRKGAAAAHHEAALKRVYMYSVYERIWHWTMAGSVLALLWTGFEIHYPVGCSILGFPVAVLVHNIAAGVLMVNAGLALFYHLTTSEIRQFVPPRKHFFGRLVNQARYYALGIFAGARHPYRKTPDRKLNPLQQVTYVALLNVLFPLQIVTGALLWLGGWQPLWLEGIGGLSWIAPIHNLSSWLFLTFLVVHVYLTTTGHTLTALVRAMVTGYEELEDEEPSQTAAVAAQGGKA